MPDSLFNFTIKIDPTLPADDTLRVIRKTVKVPPIPRTYFFSELSKLPNGQLPAQAYGPDPTNPGTMFRITTRFTPSSNAKAFATTDGHLFFAPYGNSTNRVNVFLKPSKPVDVGVKIKFFVYRGILIDSLFTTDNGNLVVIPENDPQATPFLKRIWGEFNRFNSNIPNPIFLASQLGYVANGTDFGNLVERFYKKGGFNLPLIKKGETFGDFDPTMMGFEIVVDFGDFEQEASETGFNLDYAYVNAQECILNLNGSNPQFTVGNLPAAGPGVVTAKIFMENVYHFLDPAAFYGAHIAHDDVRKYYMGEIKAYETPITNSYQTEIYEKVLLKFANRGKMYFYLLSKRGRSYNFYNDTPFVQGTSGPILPALDANNDGVADTPLQPFEDFSAPVWPIKIFQTLPSAYFRLPNPTPTNNNQGPQNGSQNRARVSMRFLLDYIGVTLGADLNLFYINDVANPHSFLRPQTMEFITLFKPLYKPDNSQTSNYMLLANQFYGSYRRHVDLDLYYNDLFGPIEVKGIYEPEDFDTAADSPVQWIVHTKPKLYEIGNRSYVGEMKVVFEGSGSDATPTTDTRTRLYVIYPVDSDDPNLVSRRSFVSGCSNVDKKNTFASLIYDNSLDVLTYDVMPNEDSDEPAKSRLIEDDIKVWKGSILENGVNIPVLGLRNLLYDNDYVNNFLQIGLTEIEFKSLFTGIADPVWFNTYFALEEVTINTPDDCRKYKLGITYDNANGVQVTYFNTASPVYVYATDGRFFTTVNYANLFKHYDTFGNVAVNFKPLPPGGPINAVWDGEYGFDWMRNTQRSFGPLRYPPFRNVMGILPQQTNGNSTTGSFSPDPDMYNSLKVNEYGAFPMNWRLNPGDSDIEYFSAWLSINRLPADIPVTDARYMRTLRLDFKVGTPPSSLYIEYDNRLLVLSSPASNRPTHTNVTTDKGIDSLVFNVNQLTAPNTLSITLKSPNSSGTGVVNQIRVYSTYGTDKKPKLSGLLNLFQGNYPRSGNPKVTALFVPVRMQLPWGQANYTEAILTGTAPGSVDLQLEMNLRRFLGHAQIDLTVNWRDNPLEAGVLPTIYTNAATSQIVPNPIGQTNLITYLEGLLTASERTNGQIKIFFINNIGAMVSPDGATLVPNGGFSFSTTNNIVMFQIAPGNGVTLAHEMMHSLGIPHTFDKTDQNALYNYQPFGTENIMDYVDPNPVPTTPPSPTPNLSPRHATYHWQWELARNTAAQR